MTIRVMYHQEDGVWWAESPDVDGFYAGGDTYEEARRNVEEALRWMLERDDLRLEHVVPARA